MRGAEPREGEPREAGAVPVGPGGGLPTPAQSWVGKLMEFSTVSFWEGQRVVTAFCLV